MITDEKKCWAVELLRQKQEEIGRMPKKEDFDEVTRSRIKAFLSPWPRALETAGLKETRSKVKKRPKRNVGKKTKETKNFERTEQHENK